MDIHLCLDTCTSERHRGTRVGVRLWRMRADARAGAPAWVTSALGTITVRCVYQAHAGVCACMRGDFLWLRPVRAHVCPFCTAARQVHLRHEGEGAPGVARPVQALGAPVRPAPSPGRLARSQRCRRCAAAMACRVPRWAAPRGVGCGGRGRAEPARAWLAPAVDRRALGVRPEPLGAAARRRAGPRATPSSRRCRRRPTGPT
jgi:hypothetical protein